MTAAEKRVADLIAALKPFVAAYQKHSDPIGDSDLYDEQPRSVDVTLGDLRRAERVLGSNQDKTDAAPDVLAALRDLSHLANTLWARNRWGLQITDPMWGMVDRYVTAAAAAIAKAEGKSC